MLCDFKVGKNPARLKVFKNNKTKFPRLHLSTKRKYNCFNNYRFCSEFGDRRNRSSDRRRLIVATQSNTTKYLSFSDNCSSKDNKCHIQPEYVYVTVRDIRYWSSHLNMMMHCWKRKLFYPRWAHRGA